MSLLIFPQDSPLKKLQLKEMHLEQFNSQIQTHYPESPPPLPAPYSVQSVSLTFQ